MPSLSPQVSSLSENSILTSWHMFSFLPRVQRTSPSQRSRGPPPPKSPSSLPTKPRWRTLEQMGGSCYEHQPITAADATSPSLPSEPKSPKRDIAAYFWAVPCLCFCGVPYRFTRSVPSPPNPELAQSVPKTPRFFPHFTPTNRLPTHPLLYGTPAPPSPHRLGPPVPAGLSSAFTSITKIPAPRSCRQAIYSRCAKERTAIFKRLNGSSPPCGGRERENIHTWI
jgi:hypothetical protein